ncbi:senescence-associated carboxylesterase 101-like [Prosopis cineraria]|uniref:senescence-associated carboxylesterase 101-like n=1 Tax=Prosopis cineraria TaxID=364024 RepID=UPI002410345D|nr:senescence-associated carboxylesterase 101-like [Prosopis cineraria]
MTQLCSSGQEIASLVASSGLLSSSWNLIGDLNPTHPNENLFWKKLVNGSDLTIIAFGTTQKHVEPDLLPSSNITPNPFEFLRPRNNPNFYFSLNRSVMSLFNGYLPMLHQLKSEIDLRKPVIVTGHAVGGSIASLFTLWLIEKMRPISDKRPLCITFGSPLVGDQHLQEAISRSTSWNSCFLHVASHRDPLPSSFISNGFYRPFGTFLLCSDHGSTCSENPDSILRLLKEMSPPDQGLLQIQGYGDIVQMLNSKAIFKDSGVPNTACQNLLQASLALQLQTLGFSDPPLLKNLVKDLERQELLLTLKKRKQFIPHKKLDEMKTYMAHLEWYKKTSKNWKTGYYDSYKNDRFPRDQDVFMFVKILNNYWKDIVEEVDKQPQKESVVFRTRWLYAGTNYRRMVEPLDIAHYYKEGGQDYINKGRAEHYKQLQKWQEEDRKPEPINRKNVQSILTMDSCFWAHVEEALISLRKLKMIAGSNDAEKQEEMERLEEFEGYVYGLLKNYSVSPEIFLEKSSYMRWWHDYISIMGASHGSQLAKFMKNNVGMYEKGEYEFPRE